MILKKNDEDQVYAAHVSFLRSIMPLALQKGGLRSEFSGPLPSSDEDMHAGNLIPGENRLI